MHTLAHLNLNTNFSQHVISGQNEGSNGWGPYGECSLTCGTGVQTRTRTCPNPNGCNGPLSQTRSCTNGECDGKN